MTRDKKGKRKKKGHAEIPVNSFADIAFLLIVFFVIASTLSQTKGVITDIPSGEKSEAKEEKSTTIQLHDNTITLDDVDVDVVTLRRKLRDLQLHLKKEENRIVLLETTGNVDYQTYYSAMTAISGAGGIIALVGEEEGSEE